MTFFKSKRLLLAGTELNSDDEALSYCAGTRLGTARKLLLWEKRSRCEWIQVVGELESEFAAWVVGWCCEDSGAVQLLARRENEDQPAHEKRK